MTKFRLDNHSIIPSALYREGHDVYIGDIDTVSIHDSTVVCDMVRLSEEYASGNDFPALSVPYASAEEFDLVWVLAGTHPAVQSDSFQLLWVLNQRVPFVNDAAALFYLNSKTTLGIAVPAEHLPASHVSNDFEYLNGLVESDGARTWVLKPTNESCGADVYFLDKGVRNRRALLQSATGNEVPRYEMYSRPIIGLAKRYVAVQEYISTVRTNEKRVIIAGDVPVCGFRRYHFDDDDRANTTLGTRFEPLTLTPEEDQFVRRLGKRLMELGIYYSGIDLAYPYVMELNLVNPGGLSYSFRATGIDQSSEAVNQVLESLRTAGRLP
jgi:glutathione synthase